MLRTRMPRSVHEHVVVDLEQRIRKQEARLQSATDPVVREWLTTEVCILNGMLAHRQNQLETLRARQG